MMEVVIRGRNENGYEVNIPYQKITGEIHQTIKHRGVAAGRARQTAFALHGMEYSPSQTLTKVRNDNIL
jgi:hypothetical protein